MTKLLNVMYSTTIMCERKHLALGQKSLHPLRRRLHRSFDRQKVILDYPKGIAMKIYDELCKCIVASSADRSLRLWRDRNAKGENTGGRGFSPATFAMHGPKPNIHTKHTFRLSRTIPICIIFQSHRFLKAN
jgi:hypothetical protein